MIGQRVFVNTIASMNSFATSKVAFCCWGTLWSPLAFGWGTLWSPLAMGRESACTTSDSHHMLMADYWHLSNGGVMAVTGCHRLGSGVQAMTVSARLHFFGGWTLVVRIVLLRRTWSRCRTSCRMSKSSSSILNNKVDSSVFTFVIADLPIGIVIILVLLNYSPDISYLQHYTRKLGWKFKHLIGNEVWQSSAMQVQVLSQGVFLDSSVNSDSSPG